MLPVIALVGRPNVGKSTLFNQLTKSRDALVANLSGLTRDRQYGEGRCDEQRFIVIDTGGITGEEAGIDAAMAAQSLAAIDEADIVLLMVDGRAGLQVGDQALVRLLRSRSKPFELVVNKIDGVGEDVAAADFHGLGVSGLHTIAATHNRGVRAMIAEVMEPFGETQSENDDLGGGIRVAVVGRPNVGKSTLVNRLLGEDRVVVFDEPGTTRDSVFIEYERHGHTYTLIDTAGVRRRKNVKETVEKFSIVKTLKAIDQANVVILLMDSREGVVDQDLHLLGQCIEAGRGLVVALNKWDGMEADERERVKVELQRRLIFVDYADIHFISALHGTGVGRGGAPGSRPRAGWDGIGRTSASPRGRAGGGGRRGGRRPSGRGGRSRGLGGMRGGRRRGGRRGRGWRRPTEAGQVGAAGPSWFACVLSIEQANLQA